jgi:hypothetical protein
MSYPAVDGVDYMADEQEMEDFGNEVADENYVRDGEVGLDEYNMVVSLLSHLIAIIAYWVSVCMSFPCINKF